MRYLDGKVAIITGASSGIGRAAAKLFAAEGARLVVAARREAELGMLVEEIERAGEASGAAGGNRQGSTFPGIGYGKLRDRHVDAGRWRGLDQPDLICLNSVGVTRR